MATGDVAQTVLDLEVQVERLTENRDFWHGSCQQAWAHRDGANRRVAELEADLAVARAERDGLAKVLREGILFVDVLVGIGPRSSIFQWASDARAALAALPKTPLDK